MTKLFGENCLAHGKIFEINHLNLLTYNDVVRFSKTIELLICPFNIFY